MAYNSNRRKLSVDIPQTPQTSTSETTAFDFNDGTNSNNSTVYSQSPPEYRSPLPLMHPYRGRGHEFYNSANEVDTPSSIVNLDHSEDSNSPPPLMHPYRHHGFYESPTEEVANVDTDVTAQDIASRDLLAVANMFAVMKQTLNQMNKAFEMLSEQSLRVPSLAVEVWRAEEIRKMKTELEQQMEKQNSEMLELRHKLENEVRVALEKKLREKLSVMIQETVAKQVEERVRQELAVQLPKRLLAELRTKLVDLPEDEGENSTPRDERSTPEEENNTPEEEEIVPDHEDAYNRPEDIDITGTPEAEVESPIDFIDKTVNEPTMKIPILLFNGGEDDTPSPSPVAKPLKPMRPLLRPCPSADQSPAYVIRNPFVSNVSSVCQTPVSAFLNVPAPTPIHRETLGTGLSLFSSPLAPRDLDDLIAMHSTKSKGPARNYDLDGFVVPSPFNEWPRTKTIVKTPISVEVSPLMIPPPLSSSTNVNLDVPKPETSPEVQEIFRKTETPMLFVLPPKPRLGNALAYNLKLLPPLVIN